LAEGDIGSHFRRPIRNGAVRTRKPFCVSPLSAWRRVAASSTMSTHDHAVKRQDRPHRDTMRARLAEIMVFQWSKSVVKATTTERLGLTGRGEGIAAQAVATVSLPSKG